MDNATINVEKFNTLTLIVDKASMGFPGGILVRIHLPMPEMWVWSLDGRSPGVGNCNTLQNSCQEIFIDRGVWWATIHGVTKSQTQLSTHVDQVCKRSARKSVTGTTLKTISKMLTQEAYKECMFCMYMAKSLRCSPETTTTLLITYTPIQSKKFKVL